ncbi:CD36 family [Trinorchestia longiramus]|nr:CD36 family [Trinorchestia longiramus]
MKGPSSNCLMIGGGVVVILFAVIMGTIQVIFEVSVEGALKLKDGKPIMDAFTVPPIPIFMSFMLFNVTNPRDAQFYGKKPKLVEVGPYVYEEHREKFSKDFLDDGDDIQYRQNKYYMFREDMSNGLKETDLITTVDVVMPMLAALTFDNDNIKYLWPEIERTMNIFNSFTVDEILFGGWELPEFNFDFSNSEIKLVENITYSGCLYEILEQMGVPESEIPNPIAENKIGYFSLMNNTDDGVWRVSTGKADMADYLEVLQYKNQTELSFWNDTYCDMINGTDGTQFPPFRIDEDTTVRIFVPELCRQV